MDAGWQVRFHGRGGQGVVTAAELLSAAAFRAGLHAQAFPVFGSERMGAPVASFVRAAPRPIRAHDPVERPDAVAIQDVTLLTAVEVLSGLGDDGFVVANTTRTPAALRTVHPGGWPRADHIVCIPATDLALTHVGRPVPNVPLLAALVTLTGWIPLDELVAVVADRFSGPLARGNIAAALSAATLVTGGGVGRALAG